MVSIIETKDHLLIAQLNEEVQNLHAALHPDIFKPFEKTEIETALQGFLSDAQCRCYVAKENEIAMGYLLIYIKEAKENAFHYTLRSLYIDQIGVLKAFQKKGVGELLMKHVETIAKEHGITQIELDHWSSNSVAASFFRKSGYKLYREKLWKHI
jgi:ribosomal protein S18 acetylase RimI-like enzyme